MITPTPSTRLAAARLMAESLKVDPRRGGTLRLARALGASGSEAPPAMPRDLANSAGATTTRFQIVTLNRHEGTPMETA